VTTTSLRPTVHGSAEGLSPATAYARALSGEQCAVVAEDGTVRALPAGRWLDAADASDRRLFVEPCSGPTLDVGCGPGRLVLALQRHGVAAHGIDVSPEAVARARAWGASVSRADVFAPLLREGLPGCPPGAGEGRWAHVLLADGNVGIGGRPDRLLGRVRDLLAPGGRAHVELHPGADNGLTTSNVRLHVGGRHSTPFRWSTVGPDAIEGVADRADLRLLRIDSHAGRHAAVLGHRN
jgi:SAM-dependent methyltransferase